VLFAAALVLVITGHLHWKSAGAVFACVFLASILGILVASIYSFARKRWLRGIMHLVTLPATAIAVMFVGLLIGATGDGFADRLTIPSNIAVSEPREAHLELGMTPHSPRDAFQIRMLQALTQPASDDLTVSASIPSLVNLHKHHPRVLRRYLASSPSWRVFEERGAVFATRRWIVGPHWCYDLHGYYSDFSAGYQIRVTIGLSGRPWAGTKGIYTRMRPGETKEVDVSREYGSDKSRCVVYSGDLVVEVFEESHSNKRERCLTKAAFAFLEDEFHKLDVSPTWSTVQSLLPDPLTGPENPTIRLWKSFQPGIYESEIWANPKESGMIYLKAFEVTRDTRLCERELRQYSNERIGWSDDPKQLFLSNTIFTIDEGDWGKPYAARFEVWFVPDSGKPPRKLMQRVFKIEGWQR